MNKMTPTEYANVLLFAADVIESVSSDNPELIKLAAELRAMAEITKDEASNDVQKSVSLLQRLLLAIKLILNK